MFWQIKNRGAAGANVLTTARLTTINNVENAGITPNAPPPRTAMSYCTRAGIGRPADTRIAHSLPRNRRASQESSDNDPRTNLPHTGSAYR
jgi:hypothetical protein